MLPSSGYFKSLTCPFFKSGFCERPHCHFRHVSEPASSAALQLPTNDEAISDTSGPAAAASSAPAPVPAAAASAALPVDSALLQEMVSRAVREALQGGAAATISADAIAASLTSAARTEPEPEPEPEPDPEPEPEPEPKRKARKHRVFAIPASVSYQPTPLRELERRRPAIEPRFSDSEDEDQGESVPAPAVSSGSGKISQTESRGDSKDGSSTEAAPETAPPPSSSKEAEEFDLLEQIMAESSKPIQMTTTLRRRLRARPVVFKATIPRPDGVEVYEPAGGELSVSGASHVYQPPRKVDSAGDGSSAASKVDSSAAKGAVAAKGDESAVVKSVVGIGEECSVNTQRRVDESSSSKGASISESRGGQTGGVAAVKDSSAVESLERHLSSDRGKDITKENCVASDNSEYSSRNRCSSGVKTESQAVKKDGSGGSEVAAGRGQAVNGDPSRRSPVTMEAPTDDLGSRKRSRASTDSDELASKRRRSDSSKPSDGSGDSDRSRHDGKDRDDTRLSVESDKRKSSKDSDKYSSKEREKRSSKDGDKDRLETRDKQSSKDSDKHNSKERDRHSSKEQDRHISRERDKHRSKDRDKRTSVDSDKSVSKERDEHRSEERDRQNSKYRNELISKEQDKHSSPDILDKHKLSKELDKHSSSKDRERYKSEDGDGSSKDRENHRSSKERNKLTSSKDRENHRSSKERDKHSSSKDRENHRSSKERDKHSSSKDRDRNKSSKDREKRSSSQHKDHTKDVEKSKSRSSSDGDDKGGHTSKSKDKDSHRDRPKSSHNFSSRSEKDRLKDRDSEKHFEHRTSSLSEKDRSKEGDSEKRSQHRSSSHGEKERSRDRNSEKRSEHHTSSRRDKYSSSKHRDKSSSSKPLNNKSSSHTFSFEDALNSSSSKHKQRSSRHTDDPTSPRPGPSSGDGAEPGPSQGRRTNTEPIGGRSGSGSPLPDLSALEELPDTWEFPDGLLQPSDLESDSDGEDTLAQCERMFYEYRAPADGTQLTAALNKARALQEKASKEAEKSSEAAGKKRVAHAAGADQPVRPVGRVPPKVTPAQAMHSRWQKLAEMQQQRIAQLEERQRQRETENSQLPPLLPQPPVPKRRRVAHVPNVGALLQKPTATASPATSASAAATPTTPATTTTPAKTVTPAQTAPRGEKRLAHTPTSASVARPKIPADLGGKVPTAIRQRYLDHFCTELLKVYPGDEAQAYKKALEEEQAVYSRSPSRRVYVNLSVGSVKRLRDAAALKQNGTWLLVPRRQPLAELTNGWPYALPVVHPHHYVNSVFGFVPHHEFFCGQLSAAGYGGVPVANRTVSHLDVLAGRGGATGSWSIERNKKAEEAWTPAELYTRMSKYALTEEQLDKNGFPRPDPLGRPGRAHLAHVDSRCRITRTGATYRECIRCARTYEVSAEGEQVVTSSCAYHWGRPYTFRGVTKYRCCSMVAPAEPCSDADCHVSDNFDPDNLIGYMATMEKPDPEDGDHGVFALDCEMSYTTQGCELTRVTVVNPQGDTVYETIVKPDNPIIDYNTRFSGIKESDMEGVTVTIRDVQAVLLNMFSNKTILIGHSLESDFKALKLIHPTVVDTSVAFPHKNGPPFKRGLKMLCQEYLKRFIQDDVGGHDSAEDAVSAMDLMMWRLREDAKLMR